MSIFKYPAPPPLGSVSIAHFVYVNVIMFDYIIEKGPLILSMKRDDISVTFTKGVLRLEHYHVGINDPIYRLVV